MEITWGTLIVGLPLGMIIAAVVLVFMQHRGDSGPVYYARQHPSRLFQAAKKGPLVDWRNDTSGLVDNLDRLIDADDAPDAGGGVVARDKKFSDAFAVVERWFVRHGAFLAATERDEIRGGISGARGIDAALSVNTSALSPDLVEPLTDLEEHNRLGRELLVSSKLARLAAIRDVLKKRLAG